MENFLIRKAVAGDIDAVAHIYEMIHQQEAEGKVSIGWDPASYPLRQAAEEAFDAGELFVMTVDGVVVASAIINKKQPRAYSSVKWDIEVPDDKVGVLHTLVVSPEAGHSGLGRRFVSFFEDYCRQMGCEVVRLDTQRKNVRAFGFYPKIGYSLQAIIDTDFETLPFPVNLALFAKRIK